MISCIRHRNQRPVTQAKFTPLTVAEEPVKLSSISALVGTVAVGLSISVPAALSGSPASDAEAKYVPIQSISYEFGSKSVSGYFVQQATTCLVTLMIIEKADPEDPLPLSPARVRLALYPGQIAASTARRVARSTSPAVRMRRRCSSISATERG
jgi:hypothetical protein